MNNKPWNIIKKQLATCGLEPASPVSVNRLAIHYTISNNLIKHYPLPQWIARLLTETCDAGSSPHIIN